MPDNNDPSTLEEPTPEEEKAAERAEESAPDIEDEYRESTERGADQEGEGKVV